MSERSIWRAGERAPGPDLHVPQTVTGLKAPFPGVSRAFRVTYGPQNRLYRPISVSRGVRVG